MKDSVAGLTPVQIAALRIFSAGLVFLPFAVFNIRSIPKKKLGIVILSAVFGNLLPAFLFVEAVAKIDSSLAAILNSLTPICVVIIGLSFFKDRIKKQKIIGVLTGFAGLLLLTLVPVFTDQKELSLHNFQYTLLILLATFLYGINVNMVGHYLKQLNAVHIATVSLAAMVIPTGLVLWISGFGNIDFNNGTVQQAILASSALGVIGSAIATALFYILVKRASGLFASLVTYGIPFIALFWGILAHEKVTALQILCLGIILAGVYLANRQES